MLLWILCPVLLSAHLRVRDTQGQSAPFPEFHFMVFGDHNKARQKGYADAVTRISTQAGLSGLFRKENIHAFREVPEEIWNQTQWEWHRTQEKGHGYWFWKSAIIRWLFNTTIPEGAVLLYADAGCEFGRSETAFGVWKKLLEAMQNNDLLAFGLTHPERRFTKGDIFAAFSKQESDEQFGKTAMIAATYFMIKNNARAREFLEKWETLCGQRELVSDEPSKAANYKKFYGNRHDQSLFSMLIKANEPLVQRCTQKDPPFPLSTIRERVHGIAELRVELLPDVGYPPSSCNPISATRSGDKTPRLDAACNLTKSASPGVKCLLGMEQNNIILMNKPQESK